MKNVNVLNDKNLENVSGGNSWGDYWGEDGPLPHYRLINDLPDDLPPRMMPEEEKLP